jgi:Ankyrin repeats (3 copies)
VQYSWCGCDVVFDTNVMRLLASTRSFYLPLSSAVNQPALESVARYSPRTKRMPINAQESLRAMFSAAVCNGDVDTLNMTLAQGADPNWLVSNTEVLVPPPDRKALLQYASESERQTAAIRVAAINQSPRVLCALLKANADPFACNALAMAAETSLDAHFEVIWALLDHGSTPLQINLALYLAAGNGYERACRILLDFGADPNSTHGDSITALHAAVYSRRPCAVWQLLMAGGDPNTTILESETMLAYARKTDSVAISALLLEHGADPFKIQVEDNSKNEIDTLIILARKVSKIRQRDLLVWPPA